MAAAGCTTDGRERLHSKPLSSQPPCAHPAGPCQPPASSRAGARLRQPPAQPAELPGPRLAAAISSPWEGAACEAAAKSGPFPAARAAKNPHSSWAPAQLYPGTAAHAGSAAARGKVLPAAPCSSPAGPRRGEIPRAGSPGTAGPGAAPGWASSWTGKSRRPVDFWLAAHPGDGAELVAWPPASPRAGSPPESCGHPQDPLAGASLPPPAAAALEPQHPAGGSRAADRREKPQSTRPPRPVPSSQPLPWALRRRPGKGE